MTKEYPAIRAQVQQEGPRSSGATRGVYMHSDHQADRGWGRRGRTPVIPGTGQRFRCNTISAMTNRGKSAFMVFEGRFTAAVFAGFLRRSVRHAGRKVFFIVDGHPVHVAAYSERWVKRHRRQIRLFFLSGCSPELNADELLNQDVKANALGRKHPCDEEDLTGSVRRFL